MTEPSVADQMAERVKRIAEKAVERDREQRLGTRDEEGQMDLVEPDGGRRGD